MNKKLFNVIKSGQYVLLIGNGINLKNKGSKWDELLKKVIQKKLGESSYLEKAIGKKGITNTEIQNIISLEYNRKTGQRIQEQELFKAVKDNIEDIEYDSVLMLDRCKKDNCQILTTNYDFNIEKYLWDEHYKTIMRPKGKYISSNYYPWDKSFGSIDNGTQVWHIHGNKNLWQSIILSLTRYIGAIHKAKDLIYNGSIYEDDWIGSTTWLKYFFTKPLIIAGLALDPQELFLRWLLLQRASFNQSHKPSPPAFYLARKKSTYSLGKNKFLKFVGVNICKFKDVYNDEIWNS